MAYAVEMTNLLVTPKTVNHIGPVKTWAEACDKKRQVISDVDGSWEIDKDYTIEIIECDDDADFSEEPDWN